MTADDLAADASTVYGAIAALVLAGFLIAAVAGTVGRFVAKCLGRRALRE